MDGINILVNNVGISFFKPQTGLSIEEFDCFLCDEANDFINVQMLTVDGGATIRMIYPE